MDWVELSFSKKEVRRSGDYLANLETVKFSPKDFLRAYGVLDNWRASHAYPLQSMLGYYRKKAMDIDPKAIVVRRLKRAPSIISKLMRESGMKLDRMEDIGGCRIVVSNLSQVYAVKNAIVKGRTRNILRRERDYIKDPKPSGYRGIHLVYRYNGQKEQYSSHSVELQIRSKVQHSWATAVEVVGTFTGQGLKASQGAEDWLEFFRLASVAFSDIEHKTLIENKNTKDRKRLLESIEKLGVQPRLKAFAVSTQHLNQHLNRSTDNTFTYFLLLLKIDQQKIQIFSHIDVDSATAQYADFEKRIRNDRQRDVVLVSADSVRGLKKAYPNYFADTTEFSKNIERILSAHNSQEIKD